MIVSSYLSDGFNLDTRKQLIDKAVKQLKAYRKVKPFDAIAFRGVSGAIMAPAIADKLGVGLIVVRKPGEEAHTSYSVEGHIETTYVVVDDFTDTGETIKETVKKISSVNSGQNRCVGFYLWHTCAARDVSENRIASWELRVGGIKCINKKPKLKKPVKL